MLSEIKSELERFEILNKQLSDFKGNLEIKKKEFEEQNKFILDEIKTLSEKIEAIKDLAREKAIEEFKLTGNKKLSFGLGIRVGTELLYDLEVALEWAKKHQICLSLDEKSFESLAKTQNLDFVVKEEKVTATFPTKLELEIQ